MEDKEKMPETKKIYQELKKPGGHLFQKGNPGGTCNPYAKLNKTWKLLVQSAVTEADLLEVMKILIEKAKKGDMKAIKELLDRLIGKAEQSMSFEFDQEKLGVRIVFDQKEIGNEENKEIEKNTEQNKDTI